MADENVHEACEDEIEAKDKVIEDLQEQLGEAFEVLKEIKNIMRGI